MPTNKPPAEFYPSQRLQRLYEQGIRKITKRVLMPKAPSESFAQWLDRIAERSRQTDIRLASERLATQMVSRVYVTNARTWREAARRSSQSRKLYQLLQAEMQGATGARVTQLIRENAALISSLPLEVATVLNGEITKAAQSGARPGTIAKMAKHRFPELTRSRISLISRTETAKASTVLTQARCERLNIDWYLWETSHDQRTRDSHKAMNGVLVPWSQAPSPEALVGEHSYGGYHAGETFNCRCLVIPILTLDDVSFPARVYWNGRITQMTKQDFRRIAVGMEERTAA